MKLTFKHTHDGSETLYREDLNETYHSIHGAINESLHVFIKMGLQAIEKKAINILELGFGTGLNAWLTFFERSKNQSIKYIGLEAFPLTQEIWLELNFPQQRIYENGTLMLEKLHELTWEKEHEIDENFTFQKVEITFESFETNKKFDLIYFDAFAPNKQPELWETSIFEKMYGLMNENAMLVTYCAKGQVRRNMQAAGFLVERLPGPPGKREMLRAIKK